MICCYICEKFNAMTTTYHLSANELSEDILNSIKSLYKGKTISITVEPEMDETEYLLSSEANRKMLIESIKQVENGDLVKVDIGKAHKK
jgi:PHD/YefM family antitoxin component YafN of YafNO toxin-antitoxin module